MTNSVKISCMDSYRVCDLKHMAPGNYIESNTTLRFLAFEEGATLFPRILIGKGVRSIKINSILSGFSLSLFVDMKILNINEATMFARTVKNLFF